MDLDPKVKKKPYFKNSGIFVFGGLKGHISMLDAQTLIARPAIRKPQNDLYLITPCYRRNMKYLTSQAANFKKGVESKICFQVTKLEPEGRPPLPRYGHAACFIKNYLVIHGGRNDEVFSSLKNVALNDLHLYDINQNRWMAVAIYNAVPVSRWGHKMCAEQTPQSDYQSSKLIIFGGINLKSFCDTSVYEIDFGKSSLQSTFQSHSFSYF